MASPRILTFNFHEPYLCLMAKTGYRFTVGLYESPPLARTWQTKFRPIPKNITLVEEHVWQRDLAAGKYDLVIAQNEMNALSVLKNNPKGTPALMVAHNRRSFLETTIEGNPEEGVDAYANLLEQLQQSFDFVFISESKRRDYRIPGVVIRPGIDIDDYAVREGEGYVGDDERVLRVGNSMRSRDLMFDVDLQEKICEGFDNVIVGEDPGIPRAIPSESFDDLLSKYRSHRCLLHVTKEDWEDGYNLSMLEAMACGMPVVSYGNRTSPLINGKDGLISYDAEELRAGIRNLLQDKDLAKQIGERGQQTLAEKFPISAFVGNWKQAIESAISRGAKSKTVSPSQPDSAADSGAELPRLSVLMEYMASPITTGLYFENAARKKHNVVSVGPRIPEDVFGKWGFETAPPYYPPHQVEMPMQGTYSDALSKVPDGFKPDVLLWIDSGLQSISEDVDLIGVPRICFLIDTHIAPDVRIKIAANFHFTFLAQKAQVEMFKQAGIERVAWLPLACSPELHVCVPSCEREYDVAYVGGLSDEEGGRRSGLLEKVRERFPKSFVGRAWPDEMAKIYAKSKIVVNACVNRDVNMRVFEAMASGALLITDEADGLEDLFKDGKHLVVYHDDSELCELIEEYLRDDEKRTKIAEAGCRYVLKHHTYDIRLEQMLGAVLEESGSLGGASGEGRFHKCGYYKQARPELLCQVPLDAQRVLDCGCGSGEFGSALKARGTKVVVGIEIVERAWEEAKNALDDALLGSIEDIELPFDDGYFDCICFGDVLEHLVDPAAVLRKVSRVLNPDGIIIMSIPNVRYFQVVEMLANGRWKYEDAGILDRTHLRFFTAFEMVELVKAAELELVKITPLSITPTDLAPRNADGSLTLGRLTIHDLSDHEYSDFLVYQYLVIASKPKTASLHEVQELLKKEDFANAYDMASSLQGVDEFDRKSIMGMAAARIGKLDLAEKIYHEALNLKPGSGRVQGELGTVLVAMNRSDEALSFLGQAIEKEPENENYLGALGLAYLNEGKKKKAFDFLKKSLDINFHRSELLPHLIQTAYDIHKLEDAEPIVARFVEFYPGNAEMTYNLAAILNKLGKVEQAREALETLLIIEPEHPKALELMAEIAGKTQE